MKYGIKYGEKYQSTLINRITGERIPTTLTYKYVEWNGYHTDNEGNGLWADDQQLYGTLDFSVAGCSTEKAAKDKIRRWYKARVDLGGEF